MTRSRRLLALCVLLALSGCSYSIQGAPVSDPGFTPPAPEAPGTPKIPTPRKIAGTDPCKLLDANDLKSFGPFKTPPARQDQRIPESCQFVINDSSPTGLTVVTALYLRYEDVKAKQTNGKEVLVERHSAWQTCSLAGEDMVCTAAIAVNEERSLLIAVAHRGASEDKVRSEMDPLMETALKRLPAA